MITPDRIVPTTCPYCGVGCNLELHIKDDYVYKVTSPFNAVVNQRQSLRQRTLRLRLRLQQGPRDNAAHSQDSADARRAHPGV